MKKEEKIKEKLKKGKKNSNFNSLPPISASV